MADSHPFANAGLGMFGSAENMYAKSAMKPSGGVGGLVKGGLMAMGIQKSGLQDFLNNLGQTKIPGSVTPYTGISDQGQLAAPPAAPEDMDWGSMAPRAPVAPPSQQPNNNAPVLPNAPQVPASPQVQQVTPAPTQQEIGLEWLQGKLSRLGSSAGNFMV